MANNCSCCKKNLGIFTGENRILENSSIVFCDKCFNTFATYIRMMKYRETVDSIEEAYQELLTEITSSTLPQSIHPIILEEAKELYLLRTKELRISNEVLRKRKLKQEEDIRRKEQSDRLLREMLLTTGYSFEGYQIIEYLGVISDGVVQGTGFLSELSADINDIFGTESGTFGKKMITCRQAALEKLKKQAFAKRANAIIGIDFDTMTFRNNMIGILATGTAVVIEKIPHKCDFSPHI